MLLRSIIELRDSIDLCRHEMNGLIKDKGILDPSVLKISQILDEKIYMMQKILNELNSTQKQNVLFELNIKRMKRESSILEVS